MKTESCTFKTKHSHSRFVLDRQTFFYIFIYIWSDWAVNTNLRGFAWILLFRKCALVWWAHCIFTGCSVDKLLHYDGHGTNLLCCIYIYIFHILQIWQKFSFHSCLQLPGDGANWTKTVFHCGLTGSCESIYSLTAMRQNGPWEIGTGRGLRKWERAHLVPSRHIFNIFDWIPSCVFHRNMQNVLTQAPARKTTIDI